MVTDKELIRQYASSGSEAAFAELVRRHLGLVYGTTLRQLNGDASLAQDVAQTVFCDLARKAGGLRWRNSLTGWLYTSARFAAANAIRSESRRRAREQTEAAMNEISTGTNEVWDGLRPIIDEALAKLGAADREAILLRYFEGCEYSLIGQAMGVGESGARMKVERALDKLRVALQRQGFTNTSSALAGALGCSVIATLPGHLTSGITSTALTQAAAKTAGSVGSTFVKLIAMKKITLVAVVVAALSVASVGVVEVARKLHMFGLGEPYVKHIGAQVKVTLAPGETLMTGGWETQPGEREFVFITPQWIDSAGNRVDSPKGSPPQITIDSKFVELPEGDLAKFGLKSHLVEQTNSELAVMYSSAEFQSLFRSIRSHILSTPRITTLAGRQCSLFSGNTEFIAGQKEEIGQRVNLVPKVSADGVSVDLLVTVSVAQLVPSSRSERFAK